MPFYAFRLAGIQVLADLPTSQWEGMPLTCVDFRENSVEAGRVLKSYGHRIVAYVSNISFADKREGFKEGFGRNVQCIESLRMDQVAAIEKMLLGRNRPTALYISENRALGAVLPILHKLHLSIPKDISIVMHDGNTEPYYGWSVPRLASTGPSLQEIGAALATRMIAMISGKETESPLVQKLKPVIRIGESIAAL